MSDSPHYHHRNHNRRRDEKRHSRERSRSRDRDDYGRKDVSKVRDHRSLRYSSRSWSKSRSRSRSNSRDHYRRRHKSRSREERRRHSRKSRSRSAERNRRHRSKDSYERRRSKSRNRDRKVVETKRNKKDETPNKDVPIEMTESDEERNAIHEEMHERLRQMAAAEGKTYPHPGGTPAPAVDLTDPSTFVFANDGSFLENFKKMQEMYQTQVETEPTNPTQQLYVEATATTSRPAPPPMVGRRRGGKILKTGIVAKPKVIQADQQAVNSKDPWAIYLQEVQKYKNNSCDADSKTRPLVK